MGEGSRRETKRNDKMQLPQKVLCGNIYRTNNAPKWTSGKAESCELRLQLDCTIYGRTSTGLDWTGTVRDTSLGNRQFVFLLSLSSRTDGDCGKFNVPQGVEREGVGVSEAAAFTSSDGDCPRGLPFRRT